MSASSGLTRRKHSSEPGIPNGWFAVAWGRDLVPGDVKRVRCFDEELVVFRTRSGAVHVLDAYCAHLGAHLAEGGRVMGETLRCPFHGWQYDGNGTCVEIPYCKRVPAKARVRGWEVVERNQMVLVWHHAEGKPPSWEVPEIPELSDPDWSPPRTFELEVPVHMQDMAENNCDPVHFHYVHKGVGGADSEVSFGEGGRFMRMTSGGEQSIPGGGTIYTTLIRDSWGLGLTSVRMEGIPGAGLLMFSSTSPIDSGNALSRWLFTATNNMVDLAGEEFIEGMSSGVMQDMRIWKNKIHRSSPVLCESDKYLAEFRRWARQFYSDSQLPDAGR